MLDAAALQKLSMMKQDIQDNKDIADGTVRGTQSRFGFVNLDDGRDAFLSPEQMDRVLPGDRVRALITEVASGKQSGKLEAEIEKLLESPLDTFVGRYIVKGQGHFVAPDLPQLSRWIFLPPKTRKHAKQGDLIKVKLSQHPFRHQGKAQATILESLGSEQDSGIESRYMIAKFDLPSAANADKSALDQQAQIVEQKLGEAIKCGEHRQDLRELAFVTIDAESTKDMDDALYIETTGEGYALYVAIAQPGSLLTQELWQYAKTRANTLYFPGNQQLMLPSQLSHSCFSLLENEDRPALIAKLNFDKDAILTGFEFAQATVRSHKKLSYNAVAKFINGESEAIEPQHQAMIALLHQWSQQRLNWRNENSLVMADKADYYFCLNQQLKIESISKLTRNAAHQMVEEAMLATNVAAGTLFFQQKLGAIYSTHAGPRTERLDTLRQMLVDYPQFAEANLQDPQQYTQLIKTLEAEDAQWLLSNIRRQLQPGQLSLDAQPHLGLGFAHYATITSPIRRFNDLYNHQILTGWLTGTDATKISENDVSELQHTISQGRQAVRQTESWLVCQFLQQHIGTSFSGRISMVNSAGIGVRLDDSGAEGFAMVRNKTCKPDFDPIKLCLTLKLEDEQIQILHLDKEVNVRLEKIDLQTRKLEFTLL